MNTLEQRLRTAMAGPPPVKPVDLARACDIKQPSVSNWLSGRTKKIEGANLLAAARFLCVRPEWLATGEGPMREAYTQNNASSRPSEVEKLRANSPREQALLDLFGLLPKSEQNEVLNLLIRRKQYYDLLLEELLVARKADTSTLRKASESGEIYREFKSLNVNRLKNRRLSEQERVDRKFDFNNDNDLSVHRETKTCLSDRLSIDLEEALLKNIENKKPPE